MKVAISSTREMSAKLERWELIKNIQERGYSVNYIVRNTNSKPHSDYNKYNVKCLPVKMDRSNTNPFKELKAINETKKTLKSNNIDYLIAYGLRTFPTMVIAARLAGVKRVLCIVNGSGRLFRLPGVKGIITKIISYPMLLLSFLLTNNILFQNKDDLNMIKKKGLIWRKNYGIINGSGVNLDTYKSFSLTQKPVFTMIGRLTEDKGVNEYLQAAKIVKKSYPHAEFNLIGAMDNQNEPLIDTLNIAEAEQVIHLIGKVEDVRPYIAKSRVFVLPSYHEGTPRTTLEAMSMGRPIITTNVPGCSETVSDGINGFKVPKKNSTELAKKMIWMIENPEKVEKMGKESRRISEEKYDVFKVNQKILNILVG